jgi:catechol 2,3-dioxygenase-like lactoylglutathione lyase family enzyme
MKFSKLGHVAFQVRDLERSLAFYRDGLGLREHFRVSFAELLAWKDEEARAGRAQQDHEESLALLRARPDDPWLVYLEVAPLQYLELFPALRPETVGDLLSADSHVHFCLEVEDAEAALADLRDRGIDADGPIVTGPDFSKQFWLTDPDGHRLELMEYSARSFQRVGRS